MDIFVLIACASTLLVLILSLYIYRRNRRKVSAQVQRGAPQRLQNGVPRRAQIARNQRNRLRQNEATANAASEEGSDADVEEDEDNHNRKKLNLDDTKLGAKKRAKLEAKEHKRIQREDEMKQREERKVKEARSEEERKRMEERQAEEERRQAEAERIAREEREKKEHEEYLKMKAAFNVEEEGYEEPEDQEKENLLAEFIEHIKRNKVVILEDLAAEYKMKTQHAIDRVQTLQADGTLTGVFDDRGKFIYVSEKELNDIAGLIKNWGRISITSLAENSNRLIDWGAVAQEQ